MYKRISKKHGPSRRGSDTAFHFAWQFFPFLFLPAPSFDTPSSSLSSFHFFFLFLLPNPQLPLSFPLSVCLLLFSQTVLFSLPPDFLIRRWCSTTEAAQWRSGISHLVKEALIRIKRNPMNTKENMFDSIRESLFYYCNIRWFIFFLAFLRYAPELRIHSVAAPWSGFFQFFFFFRYKNKEENAIDMTLGENKEIDRINLDK